VITLEGIFWIFVLLFGLVGALRGWKKEILVTFSMLLGLFIEFIVKAYVPGVQMALIAQSPSNQFLIRGTLFAALAFFGYETPRLRGLGESGRFAREKFPDYLLGTIFGLINGYFLIGTLWYYMHDTGYPFEQITGPCLVLTSPCPLGSEDPSYLRYLPPRLIGVPWLFFAVAIAFVFVIIVFV